jgi:hypothetical protein
MAASPLRYLTNRIVLGAAFISAYSALTGKAVNLRVPPMSREAYWYYQIDEALPQLMHEFKYPSAIAAQFERIAADCRKHDIQLTIAIPANDVELQSKIISLGHGADEPLFKLFVADLGTVNDLGHPNVFAADRRNFTDPFHTVNDHVINQEVWGNQRLFSHQTSHQ